MTRHFSILDTKEIIWSVPKKYGSSVTSPTPGTLTRFLGENLVSCEISCLPRDANSAPWVESPVSALKKDVEYI